MSFYIKSVLRKSFQGFSRYPPGDTCKRSGPLEFVPLQLNGFFLTLIASDRPVVIFHFWVGNSIPTVSSPPFPVILPPLHTPPLSFLSSNPSPHYSPSFPVILPPSPHSSPPFPVIVSPLHTSTPYFLSPLPLSSLHYSPILSYHPFPLTFTWSDIGNIYIGKTL